MELRFQLRLALKTAEHTLPHKLSALKAPTLSEEIEATLSLIRQAQEGDQEALGKIFARYYNPVRAFVRRRLGCELRSNLDSGDIMQETFLSAVKHFDNFELRHDAGLIQWFSSIAENHIREQARYARAQKRDRRRERALRFLKDSISSGSMQMEPAGNITLPGNAVERKEMEEQLAKALDSLKPSYRDVILHRAYGKGTWKEIADLMERGTEAAARHLHARAMIELAARMGRGPVGDVDE